MDISQLTEVLGWASVLNLAYLLLATFSLIFMKGRMVNLHKRFIDLDECTLSKKYFDFISVYKVVTLVLIVMPYISLKIMGY